MKVLTIAADETGCGYYRVILPGEALQNQGADVTIVRPDDDEGHLTSEMLQLGRKTMMYNMQTPDADVVVFQRPLSRWVFAAIQELQKRSIKVVVEIDDDFEAVSPRNHVWADVQPHVNADKNKRWLAEACKIADLVTVTTPALAARYGKHGRIAILPNYVPEWHWSVEHPDHDPLTIGWSGLVKTHPDDLQEVGGSVAEMTRRDDVEFHVVGTGEDVQKALGLSDPPKATGYLPIEQYIGAMGRMDIGIVPLAVTPFNEAKSWLKALEFASLGVPVLATPTGPNCELSRRVPIHLASRPKEWRRVLKSLIAHPESRRELGAKAREAAQTLTIERNCIKWWEAWSSCLK